MSDKPKPDAGEWDEVGRLTEESWNKDPGRQRPAPAEPQEKSMERMREGYGTAKEGADPQAPDDGHFPENPSG